MDFFLSIVNSIKVKDEIPKVGIFKSYDKNSNSIWDETEIKNLRDDIAKFANEDGDSETFTELEEKNYLNYLLSKTNDNNDKNIIKTFFKNLQYYKKAIDLNYENLLKLMSFHSEDLEKVLSDADYFVMKPLSDTTINISTYKNNEDYNYIFSKDGLIEFSKRENDEWAEVPFSNEFIKEHIENYDNNITENITYRRYDENDFGKYDIVEIEIEHSGTITKISKQDNGLYNIEETDSNGNTDSIQKSSFDEETNTLSINRCFLSPEGIQSEFTKQTNDTMQSLTYRIPDANGKVLLDKKSVLTKINDEPETYSYQVTEFGITQTFEVSIINSSIKIKNSDNQERTILLTDFVKNDKDIDFFINLLKKVPPNQLLLLSNEKLNELVHQNYTYDGTCTDADNNKQNIEIGQYDDEQSYLQVLLHEYGHFIDFLFNNDIGNDSELKEIYKIEYEDFQKKTTTSDRMVLDHIVNEEYCKPEVPLKECVAETNAVLNAGITTSPNQLRIYYYQKYFPRTICKIEELLFKSMKNL